MSERLKASRSNGSLTVHSARRAQRFTRICILHSGGGEGLQATVKVMGGMSMIS